MRQSKTTSGERIVKDMKRKTRKRYSAEEKIRIVLDGLRGVPPRRHSAGAVLQMVQRLPRSWKETARW